MSPVFAATCPTGMVGVDYGDFAVAVNGACPTGYVEHEVTSLCDSDSTGACWLPDDETISCDPGYFFDADTQGCLRCTGGYYCPGGTYVVGDTDAGKTICPAGTYADTRASECTKCPAGTYSDIKGQSACTTCPAGTYSTATGATSSSTCTACATTPCNPATGEYVAPACELVENITKCARFPTCFGYCYNADTGTETSYTNQVSDPDGVSWSYYRDGIPYSGTSADLREGPATVDATCTITSPFLVTFTAHALMEGTSADVCVSMDMWEMDVRNITPTKLDWDTCPDGFFTVPYEETCGTGMVNTADVPNCADDTSGDFCLKPTETVCPVGQYLNADTDTCESCPAGTYAPKIGAQECIPCPAGTYCSDVGMATPLDCPAGTYSGATGATSESACTACPAGTYSTATGATSESVCTACPVGKYSEIVGASSVFTCLACPAGTYSYITGATECESCPAGTYSTATGATSESVCTACPAGTSSSATGAAAESTCVACSSGTYATGGATQCTKCVATPCDSLSGDVLGAGAENEYGLGPDSNCDYQFGTYTGYDFDAQTWWTTCDDIKISGDYVCSSTAATTGVISKDTPTVDTSDNAGNLNGHCWCKMTAPFVGQYWVSTGYNTMDASSYGGDGYIQTACMGYGVGPAASCAWRCSRLWNQTVHGNNIDYNAYGYYTDDGLVKYKTSLFMPVVSCSPGQYLNADTNSCETCPAGTYSDTENAAECTKCPAGTSSSATGATSAAACVVCPAGTFAPAGAAVCLQCMPGMYSDTTGAAACTPCPIGSVSTDEGATSCTACPAGQYSPGTGRTYCSTCSVGTYSDTTGAAVCTRCPAGTYSTATGATSASTCELCPAGTYSATVGATSESVCTACPFGKYAPSAGTTSCLACSTFVCDPITGEETVDAAVVKCARIPTNIARWNITSGRYDDTGWSFEYNGYVVSGTAELESEVENDFGVHYTVKCNITSPFVGTATCYEVPRFDYDGPNVACSNPQVCEMGYDLSNISTSERDVCPDGFFSISYGGADDIPNCADDMSGEYCLVTLVKPCELGISALKTSSGLSFALYAEKYTTPAINIGYNGGMCYANLEPGQSAGAINVSYNGQIYHTVE